MAHSVFPFFQPIIETANGRIAGYEAIAMQGSQNDPAPFEHESVSSFDLLALERDVRRQAINKLPQLNDATKMSINLTKRWLEHVSDTGELHTLDIVNDCGLKPEQVVIEIADLDGESEAVIAAAKRIRDVGFLLAIDDFGAGFSLLDRIALMRPDYVKLDLSRTSTADRASLQTLSLAAKRLGAQVMCEGVETEEDFFVALGCNASHVQGGLFGAPSESLFEQTHFVDQTQSLLAQFRDMAVEAASRNHWLAERVAAELLALRELVRVTDLSEGIAHYLPSEHLLRFYICDRDGNQVSPNFENSEGAWVENPEPLGSNWSWRPYFFELIGGDVSGNQLAFSDPYQDINSGQTSQTAALFIDDKRILLADIVNENKSSIEAFYTCGMRTRALGQ